MIQKIQIALKRMKKLQEKSEWIRKIRLGLQGK